MGNTFLLFTLALTVVYNAASQAMPASAGVCVRFCKGIRMKKIAYAAFTSAAALALAACGGADEASEPMAEDVEAPAEEAVAEEGMAEEGMAEEGMAEEGAAAEGAEAAAPAEGEEAPAE